MESTLQIVDVSKPDTFPEELTDIVLKHITEISNSGLQNIKNSQITYSNDVICAIEDYLGPSSAYQMYRDELIPAVNRYELMCYHATRVGNIDTIWKNGLFADMDKYKKNLTDFLRMKKVSENKIQSALALIDNEYLRKYKDIPHLICFFTNRISLYNDDDSYAYDQFCETVGGELANWALENTLPDVLSVLRTNGIPVVVKFKTPLSKVPNYRKEIIIFQFVSAIAAKHLWNYNYVIETDGSIIGDVPPSDIISVIEINEKVSG